ncbi:NAD(P)-dependent oxidoreductase [Natrinema salifodinae]|uniref:D-3-phosphoglycerate dehydrogenase/(S)-sulfolactate dehydrogenase n=3 Tax=Natrinema salifodinae TaxID=1202768 RepID=A0A1I0MDQ2_9EURY|nr:NAD(P)-dependent oxidoreductase [Natrinema salifodinae]SEV86369.1 D-3-phosphoglycerate dehydrogenase/(S)-sulfolactate dehydrogenase [Natrinema salifodinae]
MATDEWTVLLPERIHPAGPESIADIATTVRRDEYDDRAALLADADRFDAVITRTKPIDGEFIETATDLEIVSKHGVGYDNVDVDAATENGVLVSNTPGVNSRAVAEHAITLLLAVRRRLRPADAAVRAGNADDYDVLTDEFRRDTVGLYGCGDIGFEVASLASGLDMDCCVYDPYVDPADLPAHVAAVDSPAALFDRADAVSIHAPLTAETRNAIGEAELRRLSPSGILVNTARAEIVDRDALVAVLESDAIAGAGIDVFAAEPPSPSHPLLEYDNVVTTPHVGARTTEALAAMSRESAANVRTAYDGAVPETTINADELPSTHG